MFVLCLLVAFVLLFVLRLGYGVLIACSVFLFSGVFSVCVC